MGCGRRRDRGRDRCWEGTVRSVRGSSPWSAPPPAGCIGKGPARSGPARGRATPADYRLRGFLVRLSSCLLEYALGSDRVVDPDAGGGCPSVEHHHEHFNGLWLIVQRKG